jgi:hypothetical protein
MGCFSLFDNLIPLCVGDLRQPRMQQNATPCYSEKIAVAHDARKSRPCQ